MTHLQDHYDVIIVGAGLSGIDGAYRLQTTCPDKDYAILEARDSLGGTWDLFRYPGIRSDSDMFTLGFPFEPWDGDKSIADGADILDYLKRTAAKYGIDERIVFGTRLTAADWSSEQAQWSLRLDTADGPRTVTAGQVLLCCGYYDYAAGYQPRFAGMDDFEGDFVHPQFWPEDLDTHGKRVVVIGSGATAMTLAPALAKRGAHVTMLQRSPTYILSMAAQDPIANGLRKALPPERAYRAIRMKNAVTALGFYQFCRKAPKAARKVLLGGVQRALKGSDVAIETFTPRYQPWDQRLCIVPDSDLFKAIRAGDVDVVTDGVDRILPDGVRTTSGRELPAEVVVSATGLNLQMAGGAQLTIDGEPIDIGQRYIYRGMMLDGVPNVAVCIGYTNASWTLKADIIAQHFADFVAYLDEHGYAYGYPSADGEMASRPALDMESGYVQRSLALLPKQGDHAPWLMPQNYFADRRAAARTPLTQDMVFAEPVAAR